jgi:D-alanine-D-alanine ligase-like ATP-grasp enzyme
MKICVLQPDYSTSVVDYKNYDPPRNLSHLLPEDFQIDHVFLNKTTTYRQIRELKKQGYDIFVNLCEGYLDWDIPSIDVLIALEQLNVPYTGPNSELFNPSKELMKYISYCQGVNTPASMLAETLTDIETACRDLKFPLFVKPASTGDSLGIDEKSYVTTPAELKTKAADIIENFEQALIEEYINGRELTVLVAANPDDHRSPITYQPLEFVFPQGERFKTYDLKNTQHHPESNIPCRDFELDVQLREAAKQIFLGFNSVGYARVDFRVNAAGEIFFIEINFGCSIFYPEGSEGSADYILKYDGVGQSGFLQHIINEGIVRHQRRQKKYRLRGNTISGYGIYAVTEIKAGELVWQGEETSQRIVTRSHVQSDWNTSEKEVFQRYAYPLSEEVFILWSDNPTEWTPQNHCCEPNTAYRGLNIYALRDIVMGEELTLDYSTFCNENMFEFQCQCQSPSCRGIIRGTPLNSVTRREQELK